MSTDQPERCPDCGAGLCPTYKGYWTCGSWPQGMQPPFTEARSKDCQIRQLTVERDELAAILAEVPAEIREHARVAAILKKAKANVAPLAEEARKSEDIPTELWTTRLD